MILDKKNDTGLSIPALADQYGTPLYIYDLSVIERKLALLREQLHARISIFYSLKANPNPSLVHHIYGMDAGLEVSSDLEFEAALLAGASPDKIMYLGPGKSRADIDRGLSFGTKYFIIESMNEMDEVIQWSSQTGRKVRVGIRINPSRKSRGMKLSMGGVPRQFGIDEAQLAALMERMPKNRQVEIVGIHVYYGTRILDAETVAANTESILSLAGRLILKYQLNLDFVGIGGGLGVPYFTGERELDLTVLSQSINERVEDFIRTFGVNRIIMELGRYLVADAGVYAARVLHTKSSKDVSYVVLDGGTHHFGAAGGVGNLLKHNFPIDAYVEEGRPCSYQHLTGPLCTPNDMVGRNVYLPALRPGDLIGIKKTGAYGLTASPVLFLSHRLPKEIMVLNGAHLLIREDDEYVLPKIRYFK